MGVNGNFNLFQPGGGGTGSSTVSVAVLKDVKSSGTNGGTFTSGAWRTRTLNTEEDPSGIVSISSNQFTLDSGTYIILAYAPAYRVDICQAKVRNITDSTDALIGSSANSDSAGGDQCTNFVGGIITLSGSKAFEIQHQGQSTVANVGFGNPANFGVSEVYTTVYIWKVA